ncbi:helix-turn-helix transcriptional regulator [Streptomyces sp. NPDC054834]
MSTPGFLNPETFEILPNARLSRTARDVFDILTARQEPGGTVRIRQDEIAARLGVTQASVSRAMSRLKDKGIIEGRQRQGTILIHPLLAGYQSPAHMINHIHDPPHLHLASQLPQRRHPPTQAQRPPNPHRLRPRPRRQQHHPHTPDQTNPPPRRLRRRLIWCAG